MYNNNKNNDNFLLSRLSVLVCFKCVHIIHRILKITPLIDDECLFFWCCSFIHRTCDDEQLERLMDDSLIIKKYKSFEKEGNYEGGNDGGDGGVQISATGTSLKFFVHYVVHYIFFCSVLLCLCRLLCLVCLTNRKVRNKHKLHTI